MRTTWPVQIGSRHFVVESDWGGNPSIGWLIGGKEAGSLHHTPLPPSQRGVIHPEQFKIDTPGLDTPCDPHVLILARIPGSRPRGPRIVVDRKVYEVLVEDERPAIYEPHMVGSSAQWYYQRLDGGTRYSDRRPCRGVLVYLRAHLLENGRDVEG